MIRDAFWKEQVIVKYINVTVVLDVGVAFEEKNIRSMKNNMDSVVVLNAIKIHLGNIGNVVGGLSLVSGSGNIIGRKAAVEDKIIKKMKIASSLFHLNNWHIELFTSFCLMVSFVI